MQQFDLTTLPRLIDISAVRTDVTLEEVKNIIRIAKQFRFICVFAMPCYTPVLIEALKDEEDINIGGVVGFPSGADTTRIKVAQAKELIEMGCNELDMVINVGALKSGNYDYVRDDIKAITNIAGDIPVKAILEIAYLSDEEIAKGSILAVEAGVTYVKTGTGWGAKPTTSDTIRIIKDAIGDRALIKAAGGARTLDSVLDMMEAGCTRFGIGLTSAINILKEAYEREGLPMPEVDMVTENTNEMSNLEATE
ncbi:MAG: deoxyribose-phosphate aldolase [Eubacteriales bacterium]